MTARFKAAPPPKGRHGANRFGNYQRIHDTQLRRFEREGFVLSHDLRFEPPTGGYINLLGTIHCLGRIELSVTKKLKILRGRGVNATVKTVAYRYHAHVAGEENLLRYEGPHPHRRYHHVHRFDRNTGERTNTFELHEEEVPTLAQVLDELRDLHWSPEFQESRAGRGVMPQVDPGTI